MQKRTIRRGFSGNGPSLTTGHQASRPQTVKVKNAAALNKVGRRTFEEDQGNRMDSSSPARMNLDEEVGLWQPARFGFTL